MWRIFSWSWYSITWKFTKNSKQSAIFVWKNENWKNLVANLHEKTEYVIHIGNLEQALNHELALKKVHRVIRFNQKASLKQPYIDMNTKPRKAAKKWPWERLFQANE